MRTVELSARRGNVDEGSRKGGLQVYWRVVMMEGLECAEGFGGDVGSIVARRLGFSKCVVLNLSFYSAAHV